MGMGAGVFLKGTWAPGRRGPSFAREIIQGKPTNVTVASEDREACPPHLGILIAIIIFIYFIQPKSSTAGYIFSEAISPLKPLARGPLGVLGCRKAGESPPPII